MRQRWSGQPHEPVSADAAEQVSLGGNFRGKRDGKPSDRHIDSVVRYGLAGNESQPVRLSEETRPCVPPVRYGHRSFDRQWIIPDPRVITQPNNTLWESISGNQVFLTALMAHSPTTGPALTFTSLPPDKHHYKGSFSGRVFPLWSDAAAKSPNLKPGLLPVLCAKFGRDVLPTDFVAYLACVAAHPAYAERFKSDLAQPGLRIPTTADPLLFAEAVALGSEVIWLQTFGERFVDARAGRPAKAPRLETPPRHRR